MSDDIRLSVCIPSSGQCRTQFAVSLAGLTGAAHSIKWWPTVSSFEMSFFVHESSVIHGNREALVHSALDWNATHLLFIDDDMDFPVAAVQSLFSRRQPIVITNYPKRVLPPEPTAVSIDAKRHVITDANSTGIEEAYYGGFGLSLFEMQVFKKTKRPWFLPRWDERTKGYTTEDLPFFERARKAGFRCWVDHDASKMIRHIGVIPIQWPQAEVKDGE